MNKPCPTSPIATRLGAIILLLGLGPALFPLPASSAAPPPSEINVSRIGGLALDGYDPVAYFKDGAPAKGTKAFTHHWKGAVWRFRSQEHLDLFKAAPERYAPQYGGYCAWAVSEGFTAPVRPDAWRIVNGKLYLNYSRKIQKKWELDRQTHIRRADKNWPRLLAGEKVSRRAAGPVPD